MADLQWTRHPWDGAVLIGAAARRACGGRRRGDAAMLVLLTWGHSLAAVPYAVVAMGFVPALFTATMIYPCAAFSSLMIFQVRAGLEWSVDTATRFGCTYWTQALRAGEKRSAERKREGPRANGELT